MLRKRASNESAAVVACFPGEPKAPAIYLAGFDVFAPDAVARGAALKHMCVLLGFEGLYPLDNEAPASLSGQDLAQWIFRANIALINRASYVVANLNNFRGAEPDSGTVFEVGYAYSRGIPVYGYMDRVVDLRDQVGCDQAGRDKEGFAVENFGMARNLMIGCAVQLVEGGAQECVKAIQAARAPRASVLRA